MRGSIRPTALTLTALLAACGGDRPVVGPGPSGPTEVYPVVAVVFYDENGEGRLDASEAARVPDVEVTAAGRTARSEALTGRAVIQGVPAGTHEVSTRAGTLPPFYAPAGGPLTVQVPQASGSDVLVPLTLPVGTNRPNTYMAFGDSITVGEGARRTDGYPGLLEAGLRSHFGRAVVVNEGVSGTRSNRGAERIGGSLARVRPAYTLIVYGTNDYNRLECRVSFPCFTIDSLREIVRAVKGARSLPFLGTIPPVNPAASSEERADWVSRTNDLIRPLAREEGAVLVDVHAAFLRAGDLTQLFVDHVHPNDRGYEVMAEEFFRAITQPGASGASPGPWEGLGFEGAGPVPPRPVPGPDRGRTGAGRPDRRGREGV